MNPKMSLLVLASALVLAVALLGRGSSTGEVATVANASESYGMDCARLADGTAVCVWTPKIRWLCLKGAIDGGTPIDEAIRQCSRVWVAYDGEHYGWYEAVSWPIS